MKSIIFMIVLLCILHSAVLAQQAITIEYIDVDGNIRQVPILDTNRIVIFRPDGNAQVDISYENGLLRRASMRRENGSVIADILYSIYGELQSLTVRRGNEIARAHIVYKNQQLAEIASFLDDGNLEAVMSYETGALSHVSIANSSQAQTHDKEAQTIEFTPIAQLQVENGEVVCR